MTGSLTPALMLAGRCTLIVKQFSDWFPPSEAEMKGSDWTSSNPPSTSRPRTPGTACDTAQESAGVRRNRRRTKGGETYTSERVDLRTGVAVVLSSYKVSESQRNGNERAYARVINSEIPSRRDGRSESQVADGRLSEGDTAERFDSSGAFSNPSSLRSRDGGRVGRGSSRDESEGRQAQQSRREHRRVGREMVWRRERGRKKSEICTGSGKKLQPNRF